MDKIITVICFGPEVDHVMALYVRGELVLSGDEYHDRIWARIAGYCKGYADSTGGCLDNLIDYYSIPARSCEDILELGDPPPKNLKDLPVEMASVMKLEDVNDRLGIR